MNGLRTIMEQTCMAVVISVASPFNVTFIAAAHREEKCIVVSLI
jgi:hypothetical protein